MLCCPAWKPTREERHRYKDRRDKKHGSEWGWWRGIQRGAAEPVEEHRRKEAKD